MGIYERQRHLVAAGVWGEPFRPDADAVALPLPLASVVPTVTMATPPPLDAVEAEEIKFGKRLVIMIYAPTTPVCCSCSSIRFSISSSWLQIIITPGGASVAVAGTAGRRPAAHGHGGRSAAVVG